MINEKDTAIITYIDDNYVENLENDFLISLIERAKYKGKIVILDYGMNEESVNRIKERFPVLVYKEMKNMPVFSIRNRDIPKVIDSLEENITHIMTIDGGDIWFQEPILEVFNITEKRIGCVQEDRVIGIDQFTNDCLDVLKKEKRDEIINSIKNEKVKNSGVICGPREKMKSLLMNIYADMIKAGVEFFGIDQLYFNYEWSKLRNEEKVILDDIYNYVIITNKDKFNNVEEIIFTENWKKVCIVHNAGGNWRILKRPFCNKSSDYNQYLFLDAKTIEEGSYS